jgi:iron complex transport system ATP-binding protein
LEPTDLDVAGGELVALIGPNGGGKTSLLRALARIESAGGEVKIGAEDVDGAGPARRRQLLSFLPASRDVTWPIAARDVIALGLERPDGARIDELIDQFELRPLAERPVNRLSTGERARVLTARALAAKPAALLLDEPLSNLDPYWVLRFLEIFRSAADQGQAVVVALHDFGQLHHFERALLIAKGEGADGRSARRPDGQRALRGDFPNRSADGGWEIRQGGRRSSP